MSLTSGPINEAELAGEKLVDHLSGHVRKDGYEMLVTLLNLLHEQEVVIRISLEDKRR